MRPSTTSVLPEPRTTSGAAVTARGLVQIYTVEGNQIAALQGVDLEIDSGEQVAVVGPSGSGKSTLLGVLSGALRPSAGRLYIDDVELGSISGADLQHLRAHRVGVMLQGGARNLLSYSTPANNIRFARRALSRQEARQLPTPDDLLDAVALPPRTRQTPVARLSGGEQQRVALAVAVANNPSLLLVDEPTSDLDPGNRDQIVELLRETGRQQCLTTIVVTHDPVVAAAQPRRITVRDGRILNDTSPSTVAPATTLTEPTLVTVDEQHRVQLPPHLHRALPPGTVLRVDTDGTAVHLTAETR